MGHQGRKFALVNQPPRWWMRNDHRQAAGQIHPCRAAPIL